MNNSMSFWKSRLRTEYRKLKISCHPMLRERCPYDHVLYRPSLKRVIVARLSLSLLYKKRLSKFIFYDFPDTLYVNSLQIHPR